MKNELDKLLQKSGGTADDFLYLTMKLKYHNVIIAFTKTGERIGYLYAPFCKTPEPDVIGPIFTNWRLGCNQTDYFAESPI